jgi:tellurite resistance protein
MPQPTYELITPLISTEELRDNTVYVTFQCPVSGAWAQSSAAVETGGRTQRWVQSLKGRAASQLRWSLANMVRSALGGGYLGRTGSSMVHEATSGAAGAPKPTPAQRREGVLRAFRQVQGQFTWSAARGGFVHVSAEPDQQTGFSRTMTELRITQPHDRQVMARMLAEVAVADGHIAEEERILVDAFTGGELGEIEQILRYHALGPADLARVSPDLRESMLMLAYAVAYADLVLEPSEQQRLQQLAGGFGMRAEQVQRASDLAREYVIDQLLDAAWSDGQADEAERARIYGVGTALGLSQDQVHALESRAWQRWAAR